MLKISIVMLTTAVFAGLLIADPGAPLSAAAGRTRIATANAGTAVNQQRSGQTPSSAEASAAAPLVVRQDAPAVSKGPDRRAAGSSRPRPAGKGCLARQCGVRSAGPCCGDDAPRAGRGRPGFGAPGPQADPASPFGEPRASLPPAWITDRHDLTNLRIPIGSSRIPSLHNPRCCIRYSKPRPCCGRSIRRSNAGERSSPMANSIAWLTVSRTTSALKGSDPVSSSRCILRSRPRFLPLCSAY